MNAGGIERGEAGGGVVEQHALRADRGRDLRGRRVGGQVVEAVHQQHGHSGGARGVEPVDHGSRTRAAVRAASPSASRPPAPK